MELTLTPAAYDDPALAPLLDEVQQEYVVRYGGPDETPVEPGEFAPPGGVFLVGALDDGIVACGGVRRHDATTAEVKRMYVRASHRRRGLGRHLLGALEEHARRLGYQRLVLETGSAQPEAMRLYAAAGYAPTEPYGHYRCSPLSRSFAKPL